MNELGEKKRESLEEIYLRERELEGPVVLPPQIDPAYSKKLQALVSKDAIGDLLKEYKTYKERSEKNPGETVAGNPILGAPFPEYYDPSEDERRLSEIGRAIEFVVEACKSLDKCKDIIKNVLKGPCIDMIEYVLYPFHHVDVVGSGRFVYPDKGSPVAFSIIERMIKATNPSIKISKGSEEQRYKQLLTLLNEEVST